MESLVIISTIAEIILYLGLSVLAVFAIIYFRKITVSINSIEKSVNSLVVNSAPVIEEISAIVVDIREVTRKSKLEIHRIEMLTDELIKRGYEINEAIRIVQDRTSSYINNGSNLITALRSGYTAFRKKINNNGR
jgi:uncharacterized protein YoxC